LAKVYCSAAESRVLLAKQCGNLIGSYMSHTVNDDNYFLYPLEEAIQVIHEARIYALHFIEDLNDCDDFGPRLTNVFRERAYQEYEGKMRRRAPSCFGDAGGWDHAYNIMINSDKVVRLIEPQAELLEESIYLPHQWPHGLVTVTW
jgi:hypothetical protein